MDSDVLVEPNVAASAKLIGELDGAGMRPRAALWVLDSEAHLWKMWLVPPRDVEDKREFYRRLVEVVSKNRGELSGLEASDVEFVADTHPAIQGLRQMVRCEELALIRFSNTVFNGFFMPEVIVLRMAL